MFTFFMREDAAAVSPYPYFPPHYSASHNCWTNTRSCMKLLASWTRPNCKLVSDINVTYDKVIEFSYLISLWQLYSFLRNFWRNIQQIHVTRAGFYSGSSLRAFTVIFFLCGTLRYLNCLHNAPLRWSSLFWDFARRWLGGCLWHFGTTYRSHLQRSG
jgi:hypothetical protein